MTTGKEGRTGARGGVRWDHNLCMKMALPSGISMYTFPSQSPTKPFEFPLSWSRSLTLSDARFCARVASWVSPEVFCLNRREVIRRQGRVVYDIEVMIISVQFLTLIQAKQYIWVNLLTVSLTSLHRSNSAQSIHSRSNPSRWPG